MILQRSMHNPRNLDDPKILYSRMVCVFSHMAKFLGGTYLYKHFAIKIYDFSILFFLNFFLLFKCM